MDPLLSPWVQVEWVEKAGDKLKLTLACGHFALIQPGEHRTHDLARILDSTVPCVTCGKEAA